MLTVPNVSLAAEQGSPTPYLVLGDSKFALSASEFAALGFRGDRVRVVAPGALDGFTSKPISAAPSVRPSDVFFDCGEDGSNIFGSWVWNCQSSSSLVQREVLVAGWLRKTPDDPPPPWINVANNGIEDVHYDLMLDPVFVHRMYGPGGLSIRLDGTSYPGNPPDAPPLPFASAPGPAGQPAIITYNSFVLPGSGSDIHGELNAWHTRDTAGLWRRRMVGRGPAPAGWIAPFSTDTDAYFPFSPLNPDGGPIGLRDGDYVLMRGPLWEDHWHDCDPQSVCAPWDTGATRHHAWLEMHPIDWVVRVREPQPSAHVTAARSLAITDAAPGATATAEGAVFPDVTLSRPTRHLAVRAVEQIDDLRPGVTLPASVTERSTAPAPDHVDFRITVAASATGDPGRWKGCWLVSWSEIDERDTVWVSDALPDGAATGGDAEGWTWVSDPPPYAGSLAHRSPPQPGLHQHYFLASAAAGMRARPGDTLCAAVFLDPSDPPDEVMLQWATADTGWEHRAFWGADLINWGVAGTGSRRSMGRLPFSGEWTRLEVPADAVFGLTDVTVTGVAFTLFGGGATWDYAGVRAGEVPAPRPHGVSARVSPATVRAGRRRVTVIATDTADRTPLAGRVLLDDQDLAATNTEFGHLFSAEPGLTETVTFEVVVPGYPPASADLLVQGAGGPGDVP